MHFLHAVIYLSAYWKLCTFTDTDGGNRKEKLYVKTKY